MIEPSDAEQQLQPPHFSVGIGSAASENYHRKDTIKMNGNNLKQKVQRGGVLFLVAVMCFTGLVGCGKKKPTTSQSSKPGTTQVAPNQKNNKTPTQKADKDSSKKGADQKKDKDAGKKDADKKDDKDAGKTDADKEENKAAGKADADKEDGKDTGKTAADKEGSQGAGKESTAKKGTAKTPSSGKAVGKGGK